MNPQHPDSSLPISRRTLLNGAALAGTALFVGGAGMLAMPLADAADAAPAAPAGFLKLSEFLTGGQGLDGALAARFQATLSRQDPGFDAAVGALEQYVATTAPATIDDLLARPDLAVPLRKTITQIVSAWYLGIVGEDEHAELVSYADALMYRPTRDVLVVPTYGGGPDSWGPKPTAAPIQPMGKQA
jgi:hypothetical protein